MPLDVSKAPSSASPLWVIALFIALSEATAGVAAITTNGTARLIFACFAVAFPSIVFGVFVWLLIKHAPNLYAPGQYSREITPEIYRTGISRADSVFLGRAVAEAVVPFLAEDDKDTARDAAVDQAARRFEAAIQESSVTVSLDLMIPGAEALQIPVTADTAVQSLLDQVYFALPPSIKPGTYGSAWILIGKDNTPYADMGMSWAQKTLNRTRDPRTIADVGILPGDHLAAVVKGRSRRRETPATL
jgi:hypothetical protein